MWLLGVIGVAAGLVLGIYLYDVVSSTLVAWSRERNHDDSSRRAKVLAKRFMERKQVNREDEDDSVPSNSEE